MDFKQIQTLIREFEKSSMTVLELEKDGFKLRLSKNANETLTKVETEKKEEVKEVKLEEVKEKKGYEVRSPLVGTFYAASSPDAKPFVQEGQRVEVGDTLCIIEAMKIMNEITSPVAGIVESIKVKNASPVGYDQVLMVIV